MLERSEEGDAGGGGSEKGPRVLAGPVHHCTWFMNRRKARITEGTRERPAGQGS